MNTNSNPADDFQNRGRSLSRQLLGNDMDMIGKYASKYGSQSMSSLKKSPSYSNGNYHYGQSSYGSYNNHSVHNYNAFASPSHSSHPSMSKQHKPRQPSNLITANTVSQWDPNTVSDQEQDMSAAMTAMVNSYQNRLYDEAAFLDEIQDESEDNPNFAKAECAEEWSVKEVCYWLNLIHLDKYIKAFRDQIIDGSILLRDLNEAMLINELGIKRLHVKKLLREIEKLRKQSKKIKKEEKDSRDQLIEQLREEIDKLHNTNKALKQEMAALKAQSLK